MVRIFGNHLVADDLHITGQHDERDVLLFQQFHLGLFHLCLVGVILLDAPHVVGDTELVGHVAQILVVAHDAGDVAIELACLPACQQVVEAVAHLTHEYRHAWALVAVIERELHLVALGIERGDIIIEFVARN